MAAALPAYRLRIPCADEGEFRERFAPKYVASGIFVPAKDPLAVGTRVHIKLEFRGGQVLVSGDAMVTSRTPPEKSDKPGMTMRLTALHPTSIQFGLSPTGLGAPTHAKPALTPAPPSLGAAPTPPPSLTPAPPPLGAAVTPAPSRAQRAAEREDLFDMEERPEAAPATGAGRPSAEPQGAPLLADDAIEFAEPEPTPEPAPRAAASAPAHAVAAARELPGATPDLPAPAVLGSPPRTDTPGRRRAIVIAAAAVVCVILVGATLALRQRGASRSAASAAVARLEAELRVADARLLEGRLAGFGGDSALDHLLAARAASPADSRIASRLVLLADKFQQLGELALARRNLEEATVHLEAALRADPNREKVRRLLGEATSAPDGVAPAREP